MSTMTALIVTLAWMANAHGGETLSEEERRHMRDVIVSEQAKVSNLLVKFHTITQRSEGEPNERHYEWAFSGEKRYRKSFWSGRVGGPVPERWGLAVWDGKVKKAYDSAANSGSLRNQDNPTGDEPPTWSPYSRCFGDLSDGTMTQIFAKVPLEDWQAKWTNDGKTITFITDDFPGPNSLQKCSWTFDTTKGCTITQSEIVLKDADGQWHPRSCFAVSQSKEVSPGIWLAMKGRVDTPFRLR